ncbi:MAG: endonuclease III [Clostridia bacterium]|nr:endonuclease III [Clostridia bacterium]
MDLSKKAALVCGRLKEKYPGAVCSLNYDGDPWRLLVMGRLSAQCTDERVNLVCPALFEKYPDAAVMAKADADDIAKYIFSCGLYNSKARDLKDMSERIVTVYNGKVPDNMDDLLTLPGVGRKIANLILGDIYKKPAVVADTHCIRIAARIGLCGDGRPLSPEKTEKALAAIVEPSEQSDLCHRFVLFGRDVCSARSPRCGECELSDVCSKYHTDTAGLT